MKIRIALITILLLIWPNALFAQVPIPGQSDPLPLGTWKQAGTEKVNYIRLEARRMVRFANGQLRYTRMKYQNQQLVGVDMVGRDTPMEHYKMKGGQLALIRADGKEIIFEPLFIEPPELNPPAIVFGNRLALDAGQIAEIQNELTRREQANIGIRRQWREAGKDKQKAQELFLKMVEIDDDDTAWLIKKTKAIGWIDATRFGVLAQDSAYLIAMHTRNMQLMEASLAEFEKAVTAKTFDAERYAGLVDRFHLLTGRPEVYGMHISTNPDGRIVAGPLEDREHVDLLRKTIGLPPLAAYLERYKEANGGKDVEILDN